MKCRNIHNCFAGRKVLAKDDQSRDPFSNFFGFQSGETTIDDHRTWLL